jgi:hypothetical protein
MFMNYDTWVYMIIVFLAIVLKPPLLENYNSGITNRNSINMI